MITDTEAGTVDDLIADAQKFGENVTQRMIMDWQSIGLLDYPTAQGGKGRGHGSKKALYSGNQRPLFLALLDVRRDNPKMVNVSKFPVYWWIYWGDEWVPMRQMRRAMRFYLDKAQKPSHDGCRQTAAALVAEFRHEKASETQVVQLERLLSDAMYVGREVDESFRAKIQAVADPLNERTAVGPPGAQLSADSVADVMINVTAPHRAANALSRHDEGVSDGLFYQARDRMRAKLVRTLSEQPDLALHARSLKEELVPEAAVSLIDRCRGELLLELGRCMMEAQKP
jgi:hypothetical protein